jgi:hypothetical protein
MKKDLVPGALVLARGIGEQQKLVVVISSMRHAFGADLKVLPSVPSSVTEGTTYTQGSHQGRGGSIGNMTSSFCLPRKGCDHDVHP